VGRDRRHGDRRHDASNAVVDTFAVPTGTVGTVSISSTTNNINY
jgi:hypothetical protein